MKHKPYYEYLFRFINCQINTLYWENGCYERCILNTSIFMRRIYFLGMSMNRTAYEQYGYNDQITLDTCFLNAQCF